MPENLSQHRLTPEDGVTDTSISHRSSESEIIPFFSGATVFLTGATGFLGKLLLEKILRSCPDVKRIYVLGRSKKTKNSAARLREQFLDPLYDKLRKERPDFAKNVIVIEGDAGLLRLGISDEDMKRIVGEVQVILHSAATVRFDETLKRAIEINVRGTKEMLNIAKNCTHLKAFVYISSAFSNCCLREEIQEKFYESTWTGDKLINLVETLDDKYIEKITPDILGGFPNSYAYTKAAAENIVEKHASGLPIAIIRPSIITATAKEPVQGWIDNYYGPTGIYVVSSLGLLHVACVELKAVADLVPGDMVVNACLACALQVSRLSNSEQRNPQIFNFISSQQNPLTWGDCLNLLELFGYRYLSVHAVYCYSLFLMPHELVCKVCRVIMHWIPAYTLDGLCLLTGKKPMLVKAYKKIEKMAAVIMFFVTKTWKFSDTNTQALYQNLSQADREIFYFDLQAIDWTDYFCTYVKGIRWYLLKDPIETVPDGIKKLNRLKVLHYTLCTAFWILVAYSFWSFFNFAYDSLIRLF